jgi:aryl-alcohol dehydrogenase-like predicted oxidoreductase/NAD(P)-dependent dehydrogenase (short-subunit alcohol dehydrogenase family)
LEQRNLGRSGLLVSVVGLGCNNFGGRIDFGATKKVVHKALDLGITFFDEADTYGDSRGSSEMCLGQILGDRRKDIVLATKFARPMDAAGRMQGASRRYIMAEVEASLRRLKTDWIDLYQQHQPDALTPIEETLRALDDLVRQGKVRYIGCSTLPAWQVVEAQWTSKHLGLHHFISCQEEYSLLARDLDREMMPVLEAYGLGLIPFRPLADGLLTGKYRRGVPPAAGTRLATMARAADRNLTDENWAIVERLAGFVTERGHTLLELALSWLVRRPAVASVIAGATKPEQVEQNVRAAAWALTPQEMQEIDATAVVTGGSKGLGLAIAEEYAKAGADVTILARDQGTLNEAKARIQAGAPGRKVAAISCDVSKAVDVRRTYDQIVSEFGKIDIFVNNAGQSTRGPSETITDEMWQADLDLKLFAQIRFCRLIFPQMKQRKWGRIISVLNIGAKAPGADSAPTSVSRAAQMAFTKVLSQEGAPHNVLVNSLHVGVIVSDQIVRRHKREGANVSLDDFIAQAGRGVPMGRMGRAEEFANIATFLASDAASYVTGCAINVDGGRSPVM